MSKKLLQEKGREPTIEETAAAAGVSLDETRRILKISRHPISLDRPVGESEDSYFGDFLEDERRATAPSTPPRRRCSRTRSTRPEDPHLSRARDHPAAVRPGRRLHLHAGRGGPHLQGHPRTRPADRSQGRPQAAAPGPQQAAQGILGLARRQRSELSDARRKQSRRTAVRRFFVAFKEPRREVSGLRISPPLRR